MKRRRFTSRLCTRLGSLITLINLICVLVGCTSPAPTSGNRNASHESVNLLLNAKPSHVVGVQRAEVLTDGTMAAAGDHWKTPLTAVFASSRSSVQYDLGQTSAIKAAFLSADNNDAYDLSVSEDGMNFRRIWQAGSVSRPGMQPRSRAGLNAQARYVRLNPLQGDGSYAVSELQLYAQRPAVFPPQVPAQRGMSPDEALRPDIVWFGAALALFALLAHRRSPPWMLAVLTLLPLLAAYRLWGSLVLAWPIEAREVSLFRAVAAGVAAAVVLREVFAPRRFLAHPRVSVALLGVVALLALLCFYNLGRAQFHDHKHDTPGYVHNFDMRVYYPVAKYFKELRYDGLYLASVAAYVDDDSRVSLESLKDVQLRSLRTHRMQRVADVRDEIEQVRTRFSPERWAEFKRDMRYFRETMGVRDYLGSMRDHGGNATPVWLMVAHLIFGATVASNPTLLVGGALDLVLLLAMFVAIGRTFGVRTMLISLVVFGANDFYMFGSNWAGATLRHDWMAALGFGMCALKRERWLLAGALLAWAGLIRAFPALALAGLVLPTLWWLKEYQRTHGRLPSWRRFSKRQRPIRQVIVGAAACVVSLVLLSVLVLGIEAWTGWVHKIGMLARGPHVNHVSLRALVAFSPDTTLEALANAPPGTPSWATMQHRVLQSRIPLFAVLIAAYLWAVLAAARKARWEHAAILGLVLVPVVFNPSNYYAHFVFLVPLLAVEARRLSGSAAPDYPVERIDAWLWLTMLGVCVAQYWTVLTDELDMHFVYASLLLMSGLTAVLGLSIARGRRWPVPAATGKAGHERRRKRGVKPKRRSTAEPPAPQQEPASDELRSSSTPAPDDQPPGGPPAPDEDEIPVGSGSSMDEADADRGTGNKR